MKFVLLLLLIASMSAIADTATPTATATATVTPTATRTATQTPTSASPVTYANPTFSPGVTNSAVTRAKVCDGIKEAYVSSAQSDETTATYGITPTPQATYGVKPDQGFKVVLNTYQSLGGVNVATNRYPASTTSTYFSESRREELAVKLKELMCTNTWLTPLPLATAQGMINSSAWPRYYKQFVVTGYPTPAAPTATPTATNTPTPTGT
jgi:hypothetical protein